MSDGIKDLYKRMAEEDDEYVSDDDYSGVTYQTIDADTGRLLRTKQSKPWEDSWGNIKEDTGVVPMSGEAKQFEDFAKAAMHELAENGLADFVLLKNDKLRKWWQAVLTKELAEKVKRDAIERKKQLKEQALAKLSDEELGALGIKRPNK